MIPESSPQKGASHLRDRRRWRLFLSRSSGDPLQLHLPSTTSEIWEQSRHRRLGNFLCSRCEVYFRLRTVGGFLHGLSCSHFIFLFSFHSTAPSVLTLKSSSPHSLSRAKEQSSYTHFKRSSWIGPFMVFSHHDLGQCHSHR